MSGAGRAIAASGTVAFVLRIEPIFVVSPLRASINYRGSAAMTDEQWCAANGLAWNDPTMRPTKGERAYRKDVAERPFYHDGAPRRTWQQLSDLARWSWEKNPYPLPCAPENAGSN